MSAELQLERNEDCRRIVRGYLAQRNTVAQTPSTIKQRLCIEHDFSLEEVKSACAFLLSRDHVTEHQSPDGASKYYKITAEGVVAWEASQV